ncbi:hypothetical protein sos41_23980 [Alphaproteobacteria bacterium SO-S41]|nr:hypothetical protein sos41_23980 [Alphaproteobacteria bacterium SO-S41]
MQVFSKGRAVLFAAIGLIATAVAQDTSPQQTFWDGNKQVVTERLLHPTAAPAFRKVRVTVSPDLACGEVNAAHGFAGNDGFEKFVLYRAEDEGLVVVLESDPNDLYATNADELCTRIGLLGKAVN